MDWIQHPATFPLLCGLLAAALFVWRSYLVVGEGRRALERQRQQHESLFARHVDAVLSLDTDGVIRHVNPAVIELTGRSAADLSERHFLDLIASSGRGRTRQAVVTALEGRQNTIEAQVLQPRGHVADVDLTSIPIVVNDDVVGTYEILRDATDRKKLEREL
ncbi:MAG: PAS domain S-box protein, partial [Gemmatimonadota bacterium]|nr:PAS domain S-box protein [Gemmatimonadota bacterium]